MHLQERLLHRDRPRGTAALVLAAITGGLWLASAPAAAAALRVVGSTTVNPVVAAAAEQLRAEQGAEIVVDTLGGSSGGLAALAEGRADLAMISRPLSEQDRAAVAEPLIAHPIGYDAVALVVAADVVAGGVTAISRAQMQGVYEGRITRWSELGGADRRIVLFDKEPGRGTWEVFAHWLYDDPRLAPSSRHREVGSNEEGRTKVASTPGAITQLSAAWAHGDRVAALALEGDDGVAVAPTRATIASGRYPMIRPLLLVSRGAPSAEASRLLEFLRGPRGQQLVEQHGYLGTRARINAAKSRPDLGQIWPAQSERNRSVPLSYVRISRARTGRRWPGDGMRNGEVILARVPRLGASSTEPQP